MHTKTALEPRTVQEFVGSARATVHPVTEMFKAVRALANATGDRTGGVFETALGGAVQMGKKDIASYLLAQVARLDLFAAAMLGRSGS